jgi:hypothetical protein
LVASAPPGLRLRLRGIEGGGALASSLGTLRQPLNDPAVPRNGIFVSVGIDGSIDVARLEHVMHETRLLGRLAMIRDAEEYRPNTRVGSNRRVIDVSIPMLAEGFEVDLDRLMLVVQDEIVLHDGA